ncbi:MAG: beta-lactamase family protein [Clostridia bacterium]|nr:beta-lactamase family protein [Clostridia bacterium]
MNFEKLDRFLDEMPSRGIPACSFLVTQDGKPIYTRNVGFADPEKTRPTREDDLYWVCSITKVTTCVAALQLLEQGKIALEDPVSKYLPAYANLTVLGADKVSTSPAKNTLTVEHLFTMTGGLGYGIRSAPVLEARRDPMASTIDVVNAFVKVPLYSEPGTHFRYSLCHDVLAAVVEVASGIRFADYVKQNILDPLGMQDTGFHLPAEKQSRMTTMYRYTHGLAVSKPIPCENPYRLTENYDSGGAGLYTSPADQIKLLTALACGGTAPNGAQILRPETIARMGENRLPDSARPQFEPHRFFGYGWGLCCRAHVNPTISSVPSSVGEFGWDGATGSFALVDPQRRLAMYFGLHIFDCTYIYYNAHPRMRDMIYEALDQE